MVAKLRIVGVLSYLVQLSKKGVSEIRGNSKQSFYLVLGISEER